MTSVRSRDEIRQTYNVLLEQAVNLAKNGTITDAQKTDFLSEFMDVNTVLINNKSTKEELRKADSYLQLKSILLAGYSLNSVKSSMNLISHETDNYSTYPSPWVLQVALDIISKQNSDLPYDNLKALITLLKEKARSQKITERIEVADLIIETNNIIKKYRQCKTDINNVLKNDNANDKSAAKAIENIEKQFVKDVQGFEAKCMKYTLGQKIFVAACAFAGSLLGAAIGFVIGLTAGSAIGAALGSAFPGFGTLTGAVASGSVSSVITAIKGLGIGAAIGATCATVILGASAAVASKKGADKATNRFFLNDRQINIVGIKKGMQDNIKQQAKAAKTIVTPPKDDHHSSKPSKKK